MSDDQLRKQLNDVQKCQREILEKITSIENWKRDADVGMRGIEDHGVMGYRQKIEMNHNRAKRNGERINEIEKKVAWIWGYAIGAGAMAGTAAGIIFNLLT